MAVERKMSIFPPRLSLKVSVSLESLEQDDSHSIQAEDKEHETVNTAAQSIEEEQQDNEGSVESEVDVDLVHYQSQWSAIVENWTAVIENLDEFLTDKEPWEKMADQYLELDEWRDEMKEMIDGSVRRGKEIFRLDKNPGPLTETYKVWGIIMLLKLMCVNWLHFHYNDKE